MSCKTKLSKKNLVCLSNQKMFVPLCLKIVLHFSSWDDVYSFFASCLDALVKSKERINQANLFMFNRDTKDKWYFESNKKERNKRKHKANMKISEIRRLWKASDNFYVKDKE